MLVVQPLSRYQRMRSHRLLRLDDRAILLQFVNMLCAGLIVKTLFVKASLVVNCFDNVMCSKSKKLKS